MEKPRARFEPDLAAVAALIGEPSRAAILWQLSDGRALPAGELARAARISAQTASAHLDKLFRGKLIAVTVQGRHHYYRLRSPEIAEILESLSTLAPAPVAIGGSGNGELSPIKFARTCYGHLAGKLGVAVTAALCARDWLQADVNGFYPTKVGAVWFNELGIDLASLKRRPLAPWHIDWSERRHHVAGPLGGALATRMFELKWIARIDDSRALRITERGATSLYSALRLRV
jgi:DNA-binding transcriptional ArsR family regulator